MPIYHNMRLQVKNIHKSFEGIQILDNISLHLNDGEIISLLGVSGAGKTTLFNIIAGVLPPDSGEIYLFDEEVTNTSGKISYMLQKDLLLPYRTVLDNVALPLMIRGMDKKQARQEAGALFAEFGLDGYQEMYPKALSGGMAQRVALLRTYLFSNKVALLDEPFSALDTITKGNLQAWYLSIMEKIKLSTIFITHDIDEAILLSDRVYILSGRPGVISHELCIDYPKPRTKDFLLSEEFLLYKRILIDAIGKE